MNTSESINEIAKALSAAQGEMKPAEKSAANEAFKRNGRVSKYADLAANVEASREPLARHGLAVVQEATTTDRGIAVATRLIHSSGQWIQFDPLTVPLGKQDAHGVGSATTYARRYALGAALGLVAEDDDGNAAVQSHDKPAAVKVEAPAKPAKYDEWRDTLTATADNGLDALAETWKKALPAFRAYFTATEKDGALDALKAKAKRVEAVPA